VLAGLENEGGGGGARAKGPGTRPKGARRTEKHNGGHSRGRRGRTRAYSRPPTKKKQRIGVFLGGLAGFFGRRDGGRKENRATDDWGQAGGRKVRGTAAKTSPTKLRGRKSSGSKRKKKRENKNIGRRGGGSLREPPKTTKAWAGGSWAKKKARGTTRDVRRRGQNLRTPLGEGSKRYSGPR